MTTTTTTTTTATGRRKHRSGLVCSNKMDKTVVVLVERLVKHPKYKKYLRVRNKFKAHDERNACNVGDLVEIIETRPLSRDKRWAVVSILRKAQA
jgi:small subunit ribosomal protein S17